VGILVAISPHLDDVVLGCAGLVVAHPGALVVTVAAGRPGPHPLTDWDRACGFAEGDDAVGARRDEDQAALACLGARPWWLDYLDSQYAPVASHLEVADAIDGVLSQSGADHVAMPLGLSHPDHVMTAAACRHVARRKPDLAWIVYEDVIYRRLVDRRTAEGFALRDLTIPPVDIARKRQAIERYPSQLRGLRDLWLDALEPERYWMLETSC
jgi:LmbE family N-acetylglucosaminyl deacetylase